MIEYRNLKQIQPSKTFNSDWISNCEACQSFNANQCQLWWGMESEARLQNPHKRLHIFHLARQFANISTICTKCFFSPRWYCQCNMRPKTIFAFIVLNVITSLDVYFHILVLAALCPQDLFPLQFDIALLHRLHFSPLFSTVCIFLLRFSTFLHYVYFSFIFLHYLYFSLTFHSWVVQNQDYIQKYTFYCVQLKLKSFHRFDVTYVAIYN